jgi:hypothetical protein
MTGERLGDHRPSPKLKRCLQLTCPRRTDPGLALQVAQPDTKEPRRAANHV